MTRRYGCRGSNGFSLFLLFVVYLVPETNVRADDTTALPEAAVAAAGVHSGSGSIPYRCRRRDDGPYR